MDKMHYFSLIPSYNAVPIAVNKTAEDLPTRRRSHSIGKCKFSEYLFAEVGLSLSIEMLTGVGDLIS